MAQSLVRSHQNCKWDHMGSNENFVMLKYPVPFSVKDLLGVEFWISLWHMLVMIKDPHEAQNPEYVTVIFLTTCHVTSLLIMLVMWSHTVILTNQGSVFRSRDHKWLVSSWEALYLNVTEQNTAMYKWWNTID